VTPPVWSSPVSLQLERAAARTYQLVFDLRLEGYRSWHIGALPGCFAIAFFALSWVVRTQATKSGDVGVNWYARFAALLGAGALLMSVLLLRSSWYDYQQLRAALESGRTHLVVGTVGDFQPGDHDGHVRERFRVNDEHFEYTESVISDAFEWTAGRGGPMHEGLEVRMLVYRGAILRLEIAS